MLRCEDSQIALPRVHVSVSGLTCTEGACVNSNELWGNYRTCHYHHFTTLQHPTTLFLLKRNGATALRKPTVFFSAWLPLMEDPS